ncbi:leucine--tRNA ligase [Myxococcota bacterium]
MGYDHQAIEARWQQYWEEHHIFRAKRRAGRPKLYVLDMFPYPSGHGLHVGHPEGYTATDIVARYRRMQGFDVLHPMGWDAFGLPAEQHAMATGTHPSRTTRNNIAVFRRQLKRLGLAYDWSREVDTTDPTYVRWTQWIFLQLFKRGLAFQAEIPVNWCPELGTVLANEEVIDGRSERGGHPVVRQPLRQWQLRITAYADRLADDLEPLDWPETKAKQRDWIGRSVGAEVDFPLVGRTDALRVFTTRPDTLFGATYMVIAPDHRLTLELTRPERMSEVQAYVAAATRKSELERTASKEKTGVRVGAHAVNPLSGREIPIYTADYVLGAYGTGAIMAVPAHDERDFEFAVAHGLPIVEVVSRDGTLHEHLGEAFTGNGIAVRSGQFDRQVTAEMTRNIVRHIGESGIGRAKTNYKLRDWVFSRQRYWGEPIPIYFPVETEGDPRHGAPYRIDYQRPVPMDEHELPLNLPQLEDYRPGDPQGPLARALDWRFFQKDGQWYARETNTMPQWAGSCWYYLRYLDPHNPRELCSQQAYEDWMPVDLYVGGAEHAVLHLLYARFWHKVLFDMGVVKHPEPFTKLVHQGMILGMAYRWYAVLDDTGNVVRAVAGDDMAVVPHPDGGLVLKDTEERVTAQWLTEREIEQKDGRPVHPQHGVRLLPVTEKMSKARGNVVNPDELVQEYGADSLRVYEMFMGPLEQVKPWQTSGIQGVRRFLDRVHAIGQRPLANEALSDDLSRLVHRTVKKVQEDIEGMRFNTAISAMMVLSNRLQSLRDPPREAVEKLILCLAPFAPHLAEELWEHIGHEPSIADSGWPEHDERFCVDDVMEIAVQVNGRVRGRVTVARDAPEKEALEAALADENVRKFRGDRPLRKVVYVPGKILNLISG